MRTGKGYVERELLSLCARERGVLIQDSLCSPLKSGCFFGTFGCTSKGYVERELLSLRSRERGVLIQGSLCSPLKSGGFFGTFECTWLRVESSKGLVGPCSLRSRGPIKIKCSGAIPHSQCSPHSSIYQYCQGN